MRSCGETAKALFDSLTPETLFNSPLLPKALQSILTSDSDILCFKYLTQSKDNANHTVEKQSLSAVDWAEVPAEKQVLMIHVKHVASNFMGDSIEIDIVIAKRQHFIYRSPMLGKEVSALGKEFEALDVMQFDHDSAEKIPYNGCLFVARAIYSNNMMGEQLSIINRAVHPDLQRKGLMRLVSTRLLQAIERLVGSDLITKSIVEHIGTAAFYLFTPEERALELSRIPIDPTGKFPPFTNLELQRTIGELTTYHQAILEIKEKSASASEAKEAVASMLTHGVLSSNTAPGADDTAAPSHLSMLK
ncbi:MAG: hypothetical protein P1U40_12220 [Coxiellaceae bacterium]|nr:hypothetical protein [Coxiellaceae bacterium]